VRWRDGLVRGLGRVIRKSEHAAVLAPLKERVGQPCGQYRGLNVGFLSGGAWLSSCFPGWVRPFAGRILEWDGTRIPRHVAIMKRHDTPQVGGVEAQHEGLPYFRYIDFEITVESSKGCPCDRTTLTLTARQDLYIHGDRQHQSLLWGDFQEHDP
jgi:hypothetical protein